MANTERVVKIPHQVVDIPTAFHLSASNISIEDRDFVDDHGRVLHLRGANVGASSKVPIHPVPPIDQHRRVTYVNRPFPLSEAEGHWKRLRSWGLTFLRITVTWDAIEHAGPGEYDQEYLDYLRALLESMQPYGLVCYVAIHQDVWSRYSGGSGAPGWTLEAAGFDLSNNGENLALSGAAFIDGIRGGRLQGERGLWPTGYQKLAAASMNTLFWAGSTFAPELTVTSRGEKVNIQEHLQSAFLGAVEKLVDAVGDLDTVLGIELMNEPHPGFIGLPSIHEWNYNTDLHLGEFPSPLQSFALGCGHPTSVPIYTRSFPFPTRTTSRRTINESGARAWTGSCPWETAGVWRWSNDKSAAVALQEDYFAKHLGKDRAVDFYRDFYWPFVKRWEGVIARSKLGQKGKKDGRRKSEGMRMVEVIPNEFCPEWPEDAQPQNLVYAPHWYDLNALFKKQMGQMTVNVQGLSRGMFIWNALHFGRAGVKNNYEAQITRIVQETRKRLGDVPIVFGECGVPMDLHEEKALKTGDWFWQERMMDAMISAFETNLVGFNLWNYNPNNDDHHGDDWNAENFSFYSDENRRKLLTSSEKAENVDAGGRLLQSVVRPYPVATAGTPTEISYNSRMATFRFAWKSPSYTPENPTDMPPVSGLTEIYLPNRVYRSKEDIDYALTPGGRILFDFKNSRAFVWFVDNHPTTRDKERKLSIWVPALSDPKKQDWIRNGIYLVLLYAVALCISYWYNSRKWAKEDALIAQKFAERALSSAAAASASIKGVVHEEL